MFWLIKVLSKCKASQGRFSGAGTSSKQRKWIYFHVHFRCFVGNFSGDVSILAQMSEKWQCWRDLTLLVWHRSAAPKIANRCVKSSKLSERSRILLTKWCLLKCNGVLHFISYTFAMCENIMQMVLSLPLKGIINLWEKQTQKQKGRYDLGIYKNIYKVLWESRESTSL